MVVRRALQEVRFTTEGDEEIGGGREIDGTPRSSAAGAVVVWRMLVVIRFTTEGEEEIGGGREKMERRAPARHSRLHDADEICVKEN